MGRALLVASVILEQIFGRNAGKAVVRIGSVACLAGFVAVLARKCELIDEVIRRTGVLT